MPKTAILLKKEYSAPSGQIYLQKGRNTKIDAAIMITAITVFHEKRNPIVFLSDSLRIVSGQPAETVPAGQIHAQKIGEPTPSLKKIISGAAMHNKKRHIYFAREAPLEMLSKVFVLGTFFVGIL